MFWSGLTFTLGVVAAIAALLGSIIAFRWAMAGLAMLMHSERAGIVFGYITILAAVLALVLSSYFSLPKTLPGGR
jgi:hypothetical protein